MSNNKNNVCIEQKCDICENIKNHNVTLNKNNHELIPEEKHQTATEIFSDQDEVGEYENESFEDDDVDNHNEDISLDLRSETSVSQKSDISVSSLPRPINKTFSTDKLREIEQKNMILMQKILSNNKRANQYNNSSDRVNQSNKVASATINRRRFQEKVFNDNQILLKKIQAVKSSMKR